jgi:hypothetical protein
MTRPRSPLTSLMRARSATRPSRCDTGAPDEQRRAGHSRTTLRCARSCGDFCLPVTVEHSEGGLVRPCWFSRRRTSLRHAVISYGPRKSSTSWERQHHALIARVGPGAPDRSSGRSYGSTAAPRPAAFDGLSGEIRPDPLDLYLVDPQAARDRSKRDGRRRRERHPQLGFHGLPVDRRRAGSRTRCPPSALRGHSHRE